MTMIAFTARIGEESRLLALDLMIFRSVKLKYPRRSIQALPGWQHHCVLQAKFEPHKTHVTSGRRSASHLTTTYIGFAMARDSSDAKIEQQKRLYQFARFHMLAVASI